VLTPDSSRFWPADRFRPGGPQPSFDKQPLRDYLDELTERGEWNKQPPPPTLPDAVATAMSDRYHDVFRRITGLALDAFDPAGELRR
jgi:phosphoribosylaminoimidazole-succinocarboxamide synthase